MLNLVVTILRDAALTDTDPVSWLARLSGLKLSRKDQGREETWCTLLGPTETPPSGSVHPCWKAPESVHHLASLKTSNALSHDRLQAAAAQVPTAPREILMKASSRVVLAMPQSVMSMLFLASFIVSNTLAREVSPIGISNFCVPDSE